MDVANTNLTTVKAYVAALNAGDFDSLQRLFTEDATVQGVTGGGPIAMALPVWRDLHHGLNMHLEIAAIVAEGDTVAVRYIESGRWTGTFLGFSEPTGKSYRLVAIEWFEMRDGLIARRWGVRDGGAQASQLGFPLAA
ncbi:MULTISPECIES: nuclear transport factor 2 family protein [unclassified Beijerinckia]|uniref:ester cyclase n=1 Tax=unclassified Beijerinckia TaxID=2638183 RepID=UPI000894B246|nr:MULTISPECIES: nuclear transport factor 2 family protein [unclassified Beijerinckia]MDH7795166.1 putative ester cyclase [Beijerinckia sp. GAS462]SEB90282.1 Predicted ester cyclase [Beijerinckia sp. 28-YEA-48]